MSNSPAAAGTRVSATESQRLLTTAKAAEVLGLTPQRLRVLRTTGTGPRFVKLTDGRNAKAYYAEEDVLTWRAALPRRCSTALAAALALARG